MAILPMVVPPGVVLGPGTERAPAQAPGLAVEALARLTIEHRSPARASA
jgi:hypothetical protein